MVTPNGNEGVNVEEQWLLRDEKVPNVLLRTCG